MAANKKAANKKAEPKRDPDMPEGFEPLGMTRVAGWFVREVGNRIQGTIQDSFEVKAKGKYGARKVYKIEITSGATTVVNAEGEQVELTEGLVGLDETGYLKKLADLEKGREVFIKCKGKEDPDDRESPWIFVIGAVPF